MKNLRNRYIRQWRDSATTTWRMALTDLERQDEPRTSARDLSDRASSRPIEFDDDEDLQFLRTEKRVPVRRGALPKKARSRVIKAIILVVVITVLCTVAAAGYRYGIHSWRFRIESSDNIEITGVQNASHAQVMDVVGADIGRNIFFVPLDERKRQLERIPWVESAAVMRLLPNRIAIHIQERTPVAFVQIGPKTNLIDAGGVVMGMPASRQIKYSFPVIQGMTESEPLSSRAAAMKIYNLLVRDLDSDGSRYSGDLSEVDLSDPEDVKVTANNNGGAVMIYLGAEDFLPRYKLYVTHIAEWKQQFQNLHSIDLRYDGQIIVNPDANQAAPPAVEQTPAPQAVKPAANPVRHRAWKKK